MAENTSANNHTVKIVYIITSNDRPFGCPIIYTNVSSQCYFAQQCLTQQCSFSKGDAMFGDNCFVNNDDELLLQIE